MMIMIMKTPGSQVHCSVVEGKKGTEGMKDLHKDT